MGYVPPNAQWYVAELVEETRVEGDVRNVVHKNLVLIRADSPEDAYEKALFLGRESQICYENPDGKQVYVSFRGLGELNVIHDQLDHGAELLYEQHINVPNEQIQKWVLPREQLAIFRAIDNTEAPDYSSKEIMDEVRRVSRNST